MELDDPSLRYSGKTLPGDAYEYVSFWVVYSCKKHDITEIFKPDVNLLRHRVIYKERKYIIK